MKTIVYCFVISCTSIYATCNKRIDCKQTIYSFEGNYKAFPDLDSIQTNDTIWLESTLPTQIKDLISNRLIDYSGAENLGVTISYLELIGGNFNDPGSKPSANTFINVLAKGKDIGSLSPEQTRSFGFAEESGSYKFKLGIIPKSKGLFAIGISNATNVYTKRNKCDKASFNFTFKETNQHLYLYEQSRPGYEPSGYERTHMYCFKVY